VAPSAASPGLGRLANFGLLQLDVCCAYAAAGDAGAVGDAEMRLSAARAALLERFDARYEGRVGRAPRRASRDS